MNYTLARRSEELAQSSHQLAEAGHRINMLAAIFLPLMTVATLFGMNLISGLEDRSPVIFWIVGAAGLLLGMQVRSVMAVKRPQR
jgi:Mg2+ and Co2+ transporter CorA